MIQPYLFFNGRCQEALDFYREALGAELQMSMRFGESPDEPPPGAVPEDWDDKIMHASLTVGGARIMMSDGGCSDDVSFHGFSLSLTAPDVATADRYFEALADGGEVQMPMDETFWSKRFGMVTDRFGVGWMVTVPEPEQERAS